MTTLLFAIGLWVAVNLAGDVQTTIDLPLTVDLPEGHAAASSLPRQISATLRGPGWKVLQYALLGHPLCRVDLRQPWSRDAATITRRMMTQAITLPSPLTLSEIEPDSIHIALDVLRDQTVPVIPVVRIDLRHGFEQSGPATADPDSIRISGAESVVRRIASWSTRPVTITEATRPVRVDVDLSDSLNDLVRVPARRIAVTADIQESAERAFLHIPVTVANAPHGVSVHLVPATVTVLLRAGVETLAAMQPADVRATVDYWTLIEDHPERAPVAVSAPPHTAVLRHEPRMVAWFLGEAR